MFKLTDNISGGQIKVGNNYLSHFSTKTDVVAFQKNRLNEMANHLFKLMDKKLTQFCTKNGLSGLMIPISTPKPLKHTGMR